MNARTSLLVLLLAGCTSTVMAQTTPAETASPAVPTRYTLISFVDNGDMTVATVPAPVGEMPKVIDSSNVDSRNVDGGDGISDSPESSTSLEATDQSTSSRVRIN